MAVMQSKREKHFGEALQVVIDKYNDLNRGNEEADREAVDFARETLNKVLSSLRWKRDHPLEDEDV